MSFCFLHSSDLHLGRRYANMAEAPDSNLRGRLIEARYSVLGRLAAAARDAGARHILLAGDTFDTPTPAPQLVRQTLAAMAEDPDLSWWILPGNHDNLREAEPLWDTITRTAAPNIHALTEANPHCLDQDRNIWLLPCPVTWRAEAGDPTQAMDAMQTPEGACRIGLAHGGISDFTGQGAAIAPDRDRRADLGYLALGDWHGRMEVSARVHYCGTPEQDRFKHNRRGVALAVRLDGAAPPDVREIETGQFLWAERTLDLTPHQDMAAAIAQMLAPDAAHRDILLRVVAQGWATLSDQHDLAQAADTHAPAYGYFELRTRDLGTQYDAGDLDEIDHAGALRHAAQTLKSAFEDTTQSESTRKVAADALARLYAYTREDTTR